MTEHILTESRDRVLTIRFNRADKKNALTQAMYAELARLFTAANDDAGVRAILLAGQPDCFSAGNDMKDFLSTPPNAADHPTLRFMQAMATCTKPIVAAPAGLAIGVGVTMLLHCDLVYCGERTRLHMPFNTLGIRPEFASTYLLPRIMGHVRASELLLLGEFTAQKALDYGLVNAVLPNDQVEAAAAEKARTVAQLPPTTARAIKSMLKHWHGHTIRDSIPWEMNEVGKSLALPEALECISAFMQKRKPDFTRFS